MTLIIRLLFVLTLSLLSACVTYRAQTSPDLEFDRAVDEITTMDERMRRLSVEEQQIVETTLAGESTETAFCSEPVMSLLTLGLIPRVCSGTYTATLSPADSDGDIQFTRNYETKFIAGWLALLLLPFPDWKYGGEEGLQGLIKLEIVDSSK